MKRLQQFIKDLLDKRHDAKMDKREKHLTALAEEEIQVKEFEGKIYISFRDIPLVPNELMWDNPEEDLPTIRQTYVNYRMKQSER